MSDLTNIETYFDDIENNMLRFFEGWDTYVPHQGEKGGIRERRVKDFLEAHLPQKYSVGTGHIIDRHGNMSLQEDIVIYDAINSPILKIDDQYQLFPCESVYATVEVKSTLNKAQIVACIKHTEKLHTLDRGDMGPMESFVFAYDSYLSKKLSPLVWAAGNFKIISNADGKERPMPSIILSLKQKFILFFGLDTTKHIAQGIDRAILVFYINTILNRLDKVQTSPPSLFHDYAWSKGNPLHRYTYSINEKQEIIL